MVDISSRILFAIIYADIFNFIFTKEELIEWLPFGLPKNNGFGKSLQHLTSEHKIIMKERYVMLPNRQLLLSVRQRRRAETKRKMNIVFRIATILSYIPTVRFIGVTGSLAMGNAARGDDIDICIVAQNHTVWVTRLLVTLLVDFFGKRRKPRQIHAPDAICLNMFLSKKSMRISKKEQDLYSAHEVLQMVPVFDRGGVYRSFIRQNQWARHFFPTKWQSVWRGLQKPGGIHHFQQNRISMYLAVLEPLAYAIEKLYMQHRITTEVVSRDVIRFHPHDMREYIKDQLLVRQKLYKLPLDKKFFRF